MRTCIGAAMENSAVAVGGKRKVDLEATELSSLKTRRLASSVDVGSSTCESSSCSDRHPTSCCLSKCGSSRRDLANESSNFADLQEVVDEGFATSSGDSVDFGDSRESTPLSEVEVEDGKLETTARPRQSKIRQPRCTAAIVPSKDELEDFFVAAEKDLHKKFINKYNYDIVRDAPLEGRYEWVQVDQLKP